MPRDAQGCFAGSDRAGDRRLVLPLGGCLPPSRQSGLGVLLLAGLPRSSLAGFGVYCRGCLRGFRDKPWACSPVPMKKTRQLPSTLPLPRLEPVTNQRTPKSHSKPVSRCSLFHANRTKCSRCKYLTRSILRNTPTSRCSRDTVHAPVWYHRSSLVWTVPFFPSQMAPSRV